MKKILCRRAAGMLLALLMMTMGAGMCHGEEKMEKIRIGGSLGEIYGILSMPEREGPVPLVILSHGFGGDLRGNEDYAAFFTRQGFAVYNFDFCGGGRGSRSAGSMLEMTVLTEAEDLGAVMDHFAPDPRFSCTALWGGSQGGFVTAYVSAARPEDAAAVVLEFPAIVLQEDAKKRANADGSFPETSNVMGNIISRRFNEVATSFDLYDLIGAYRGPVLILHGDRDPIVPLSYSERARDLYERAELIVMPGQGHGFTGAARQEAMEKEAAFLKEHMARAE